MCRRFDNETSPSRAWTGKAVSASFLEIQRAWHGVRVEIDLGLPATPSVVRGGGGRTSKKSSSSRHVRVARDSAGRSEGRSARCAPPGTCRPPALARATPECRGGGRQLLSSRVPRPGLATDAPTRCLVPRSKSVRRRSSRGPQRPRMPPLSLSHGSPSGCCLFGDGDRRVPGGCECGLRRRPGGVGRRRHCEDLTVDRALGHRTDGDARIGARQRQCR